MLRTITKDELKLILDNHKLWLNGDKNGVRADLSCADLSSTITCKYPVLVQGKV